MYMFILSGCLQQWYTTMVYCGNCNHCIHITQCRPISPIIAQYRLISPSIALNRPVSPCILKIFSNVAQYRRISHIIAATLGPRVGLDILQSSYECCVHGTSIISIKIPIPGLAKMKRRPPQIIGISRSACSFLLGKVLLVSATDCRVIFRLD